MSKAYTSTQFINFIESAFGPGKLDGRHENIQTVCPICKTYKGSEYSKRKLAIKIHSPHIVHCWVCGYKSHNLIELLRRYRTGFVREYKEKFLNSEDLTASLRDEEEKNKKTELPIGFRLLVEADEKDNYAKAAKNYLKSRGITTKSKLWYWKFGITDDKSSGCRYRIIIPSYDEDGNLNYWTARTWSKKVERFGHKYKNPNTERTQVIFNENNIDWDEELTLVEGPFDLLKCDDNATAVLGSELNANYKLFQKILKHKTPVLMAFDNEPKAQNKQMKIASLLSEFGIRVRIAELRNTNRDVGDLSPKEFSVLKQNARVFSEDYLLRTRIASII